MTKCQVFSLDNFENYVNLSPRQTQVWIFKNILNTIHYELKNIQKLTQSTLCLTIQRLCKVKETKLIPPLDERTAIKANICIANAKRLIASGQKGGQRLWRNSLIHFSFLSKHFSLSAFSKVQFR